MGGVAAGEVGVLLGAGLNGVGRWCRRWRCRTGLVGLAWLVEISCWRRPSGERWMVCAGAVA